MTYRLGAAAAALLVLLPLQAQDGPPPPEQVVAENDRNGDKAIDRQEWAASPAPIPYPEDADTNKDGKIDVSELAALFQRFLSGDAPPPGAPAPTP